ncbi:MAG TPA: GNAT family N-acetyltransferase [Actinomycetota bacterium]|nr:GNAT family N-acetyltransferase [Actinomycetota bacterium]
MTSAPPAWASAHTAAEVAGVSIKHLTELEDAHRVDRVIAALWGEEAVLSAPLIRALQHAGSVLYGAEGRGDLVGFVFGFVGFDGGLHLHSHMLGVLPDWQEKGVGYALKLAQRAACLDQGLDEVRWTFDPLIARNARFNLVKLGAVGARILIDFYGDMPDRVNRGDRSDRFEVVWRLRSERVDRALRRGVEEPPLGDAILEAMDGETTMPRPRLTGTKPSPGATVTVPRDYLSLREKDPALAREWREASAEALAACFGEGLEAAWMMRDGRYVFEPRTEER